MSLRHSAARVELWALKRSGSFFDWLRAHPAAALAVFGLALYGLLRIDYLIFFGELGLAPEDVGLGYSESLVQSAIAAFAITVVVLVVTVLLVITFPMLILAAVWLVAVVYSVLLMPLLILYPVYFLIVVRGKEGRTVRGDRRKLVGGWWRLTSHPLRLVTRILRAVVRWLKGDPRRFGLVLMLLTSLVTLFILIALWIDARWAANEVRRGDKVELGTLDTNLLPLRAMPARVFWVDPTPDSHLPVNQGECLLWLGSSGGTAVFYDFRSKQAVRVPSASIVVHHQETCPP